MKNNLVYTFELANLAATNQFSCLLLNSLTYPAMICLLGPLGVGKTQFTKYLFHHFGCNQLITSSSFVKASVYFNQKHQKLVHIDAYHTLSGAEIWSLLQDHDDATLTIIEWTPKELLNNLFQNSIVLEWKYFDHNDQRQIQITAPFDIINVIKEWNKNGIRQ